MTKTITRAKRCFSILDGSAIQARCISLFYTRWVVPTAASIFAGQRTRRIAYGNGQHHILFKTITCLTWMYWYRILWKLGYPIQTGVGQSFALITSANVLMCFVNKRMPHKRLYLRKQAQAANQPAVSTDKIKNGKLNNTMLQIM